MKRFKEVILVLLILALAGLIVFLGVNAYVRAVASRYILTEEQATALENVDCIIIPGAKVRGDGSPSLMLESRLSCGISLYNLGVSEKMLLSGDHGRNEYDEVNNMMNYILKNCDAEKENIFLDHAGFSTYETAYRAKEVFNVDVCIITTQKYHLYRAVYNARARGVEAYGVACDDRQWPGMLYYELRESVAIFKDFIKCIIGAKPTYLGEEISVSGSAAATHDKQ